MTKDTAVDKRSHFTKNYGSSRFPHLGLPTFLIFLILLIAFLIAVAHFSVSLLREEIQRRTHELSVQLLFDQIEHKISERCRFISALSTNHYVRDAVGQLIPATSLELQIVLNTANETSHSQMVYLINREGMAIAGALTDGPPPKGYNYSFRPYFQQSLAGQTSIFAAQGAVSGVRSIFVSAPVYSHQDIEHPAGVIALQIPISEIEDLLYAQREKIALFSPDGVIFSSNQAEWIFKTIKPLSSRQKKRIAASRQFGQLSDAPLQVDLSRSEIVLERFQHYSSKRVLSSVDLEIVSFQKKNMLKWLSSVSGTFSPESWKPVRQESP